MNKIFPKSEVQWSAGASILIYYQEAHACVHKNTTMTSFPTSVATLPA
jgi:hypothetical protein